MGDASFLLPRVDLSLKHLLHPPEEWDKLGAKACSAAFKKDKREKAKAAKKERKKAAFGKEDRQSSLG